MKLLLELCQISSPSRSEDKLIKFIMDYVKEYIEDTTVVLDEHNNLYITRGESDTYPIMVAHTDQVQKAPKGDRTICRCGDIIFGYDEADKSPCGPGFDDKTGVYIALKMLAKHPVMKCAFFMGEECGCIGSGKANMDFFKDARFVLQCDRRNNSDLITKIAGTELCSKEFIEDVNPKEYGYAECPGLSTDVGTLKHKHLAVSCVNMSCGYYNPHTANECQSVSDLEKCIKFVDHIICDCTKVYPHENTYTYNYGYNGGSSYGGGYSSKYTGTRAGKALRNHQDWFDRNLFDDYYDDDDYPQPSVKTPATSTTSATPALPAGKGSESESISYDITTFPFAMPYLINMARSYILSVQYPTVGDFTRNVLRMAASQPKGYKEFLTEIYNEVQKKLCK